MSKGSAKWHRLRLYADATPLTALVTRPAATGRRPSHDRRWAGRQVSSGEVFGNDARLTAPALGGFVGRRRCLQRCLHALTSLGSTAFQGVLIHGTAGLGKSRVAAVLCERLRSTHQSLVWTGQVTGQDLLSLVDRVCVPDTEAERQARDIVNRATIPLPTRLRSLFAGPLKEAPILFVFDDFEPGLREPGVDRSDRRTADALTALTVVLRAIKESDSHSLVLVTSRHLFPLSSGVALFLEGLELLHGADLEKKRRRLAHLCGPGEQMRPLQERALAFAAGNPRLMEWLDRVLADPHIDQASTIAAIEAENDVERDDVLSRVLLNQLGPPERRLLALLSLYRVSVNREVIAAVTGRNDANGELKRLVTLGSIDERRETATWKRHYLVSPPLLSLLADDLSQDERRLACSRAARLLHQMWSAEVETAAEERLIEIHRLSVIAEEGDIAADAANRLAKAYDAAGRSEAAVGLLRETLRVVERVTDPEHPHTLTCRNNPGGGPPCLRAWGGGRPAPSGDHENPRTGARSRASGHPHQLQQPSPSQSCNNLALASLDVGNGDEVIGLLLRTLDIMARVLGRAHATTLTSRHTLALSFRNGRRYWDAIAVLRETVRETERELGPTHPYTFASRNNLALAYRDAGHSEEAVRLLRQTLETMERVLGPTHPDTLTCRTALVLASLDPGRGEAPIAPLRETLESRARELGAEHPDTLTSRIEFALAYRDAGRNDEAIRLLRVTLVAPGAGTGAGSSGHPRQPRHSAEVYSAGNRDEEAEVLQNTA